MSMQPLLCGELANGVGAIFPPLGRALVDKLPLPQLP